MTDPTPLHRDERGSSLIEVVMSVMLLSVVSVGLAGSALISGHQLRLADRNMSMWLAGSNVLEEVAATDFDALAAGADTIDGYPVTWTVSGSDPKTITVVVETPFGDEYPHEADTLVTVLTDGGSE